MSSTRLTRRAAAAAALVLLALAASCATNPVTGRRELSLVSQSQEIAIGKDGYPAVVAEYGLVEDPKIQAYVDSVGQALARVSHLPTLAWKFTVIDDPVVNAFAMPGGYIYVTRGILAHLNSEAQLAGVLGHEIGHVTARHAAQRITQQQIAGLGLALGSVFSTTFARYSEQAQTALGLLMLKYGRDDENQADQLGVDYATAGGWDPREIPATYRTLGRISDLAGQRLPFYLSTHPDPGDREARTTALSTAAAAGKKGLEIRQRAYVGRLDGLVFGRDPRQGFVDGGTYYHPGLRFTMELPGEWTFQDTREALALTEPGKKAQLVASLETTKTDSPAQEVESLRAAGAIAGAAGASETIGGWPAWVGRVQAPAQDGTAMTLTLAFVRRAPNQMLRFVGQTATPGDLNEARMIAVIRSLRPLSDPARLAAQPARVRVVRVSRSSTLEEFLKGQGALGARPEEIAIMNDMEPGGGVAAGQSVKIVTAAKLR